MDVRLLGDETYHRHYLAGEKIFGSVREIYIVVSGRVDIYKSAPQGSPVLTGAMGPGEPFGKRNFFGVGDSLFKAGEDTTVFVLNESNFDEIVSANPRIAYGLLKSIYVHPKTVPVSSSIHELMHKRAGGAQVDQANIAKVREALREKYRLEQLRLQQANGSQSAASIAGAETPAATSAAAPVALDKHAGLYPPGHKSYPGVVKPEYAKMVFKKSYKCPHCAQTFEGTKIFYSKLVSSAPPRYDLRKYYDGFQTEWYEVLSCPNCYFSMFADYFTEPKYLSKAKYEDALKEAKSTVKVDLQSERDIDTVFTLHYLALVCAAGYTTCNQLKGKLWANLSWLYEDVGDGDMMRYAARMSAEAREESYMEGNFSPAQEQALCLSTAGMIYRSGEEKDVKKWLFKAKTMKSGKRIYADLADDLIDIMRNDKDQP